MWHSWSPSPPSFQSLHLFRRPGLAAGIGLNWEPEHGEEGKKTLKWLGLIGDLFIRSLKCVVLPLVLSVAIISVMEMMKVKKGEVRLDGRRSVYIFLQPLCIHSWNHNCNCEIYEEPLHGRHVQDLPSDHVGM
jgi:hypothetical protein